MKKQLKMNEDMQVLRTFYILNSMRSCELDYREQRSKRAHSPGFQTPGFDKYYEIFEGILEIKGKIHKVVFHHYQKIINDMV